MKFISIDCPHCLRSIHLRLETASKAIGRVWQIDTTDSRKEEPISWSDEEAEDD